MLGMLMCAVLLLFCGLWECCFRLPKQEIENIQTAPVNSVTQIQHSQSCNIQPPNYDELDQPPSYFTLFPNVKTTETTNMTDCSSMVVISMQESSGVARSDDNQLEVVNVDESNDETRRSTN